jgi:peptide/nickel transport system substrate-binding protein
MRRLAGGVLLFCLACTSVGCDSGGASDGEAPHADSLPLPEEPLVMTGGEVGRYGGRFVIVGNSGPETFNPVVAVSGYTIDITDRLFTHLTELALDTQQDGPGLAAKWECSQDALSCTYHLRRGAKFSDGMPITSADVAFSFATMNDERVAAYQRSAIQMDGVPFTVETPDPLTAIVRAPQPNSNLFGYVTLVSILPKHVLGPALESGAFNQAYSVGTSPEQLVTSGPWRLKQFATNDRTVLTRNPHWFGVDAAGTRLPYLDELVFLVAPDLEAADLKFRSGEVDALTLAAPANSMWYSEHQQEGNFTLHELGPAYGPTVMFFNQNDGKPGEEPPIGRVKAGWFKNATFRRAVSMAIDREAIIRSAMSGRGVKSWRYSTPADKIWSVADFPHDDYDPAQARQLLASLGWTDRNGDGFVEDTAGNTVSFSLSTTASNAIRVAMTNFVRDDLAKVGLKVTLAPMEFNTLVTNVNQSYRYDAVLLGYTRSRPDPMVRFWVSGGIHPWERRRTGPVSPEQARVDDLSRQILGSLDVEKRKTWLAELDTIANQQAWMIWLPVQVNYSPIRSRFGNLRPSGISTTATAVVWNAEQIFVRARDRSTN